MLKILVADDHELFRDGIGLSLMSLDPDVQTEMVTDYDSLFTALNQGKIFDLILTDLAMPGMKWTDALARLRKEKPQVPVVVLSAVHDRDSVLQAIELGASGFVPKTSSARVILSAIQLVMAGGTYLPPDLLQAAPEEDHSTTEIAAEIGLTPRQMDVLEHICQGKSNKVIARDLDLTEGTVKLHVTAILKALNVQNRTEAVIEATKQGLFAE